MVGGAETDSFTLFGPSHLLTLASVATLGTIALLGARHLSRRTLRRLHPGLSGLLLFQELLWRILFWLHGEFRIGHDLPFHLSGAAVLLLSVYLLLPRQKLLDVLYYWVLSGSSIALIVPDLESGFPHLRFFSIFVGHALTIWVMLYLLIIQRHRPNPGSHRAGFGALALYGLGVALPVNWLTGGNYLYMFELPPIELPVLDALPPWPWYLLVWAGFFYLLFWALDQAFLRVRGRANG